MPELVRFQKLTKTFSYTEAEQIYLDSLKPFKSSLWKNHTNAMNDVKKTIKEELGSIQEGFCIYCGLRGGLKPPFHREHIAPKDKYPEFMFEPYNLVLSCSSCNGITVKGDDNTIDTYNSDYSLCTFNIVHPYFDNFDEHIEFNKKDEYIILKGITAKGKKTIKLFNLNNEDLASLRGIALDFDKYQITDGDELLLEEIIKTSYSV